MQLSLDAPDLVELGRFIRAQRRALGLTQSELGERLGYVQERMSLLESGKYGLPSLPALAGLAIALEVPFVDVLRATGFPVDTEVPALAAKVRTETVPGETHQVKQIRHLGRECVQLRGELMGTRARISALEKQMLAVDALRKEIMLRRSQLDEVSTTLRAFPRAQADS